MFDVVVAGGGPVGMWLAAELHRAGVSPVVLERREERSTRSKGLTLYPRSLEMFAMRGIAEHWLAEGTPVPSSHFAILTNRLDFTFLDTRTRFPFTLFLPQRRTEELLEEHLASLGVPYLRQHTITGLRQDVDGVDIDVSTPAGSEVFHAAYVVGCDGAGSTVRKAAGIEFEGTPDSWTTIMGDIELTDPPPGRALTLNEPGGSIYMVALGDGRYRLATVDLETLYDLTEEPPTFEQLRASARRIAGTDYGMRETDDAWLSRVGNGTRQAAKYRVGRVLLAGDSAHIHYPAGGQGLNLGLQDAANLAWKLAAEVEGWAPEGLLDSYHAERHPVGMDVIQDSLAQGALFANPTREGVALRERFNKLLGAQPELCRDLAIRLSGVDVCYPEGGIRVPDLELRGAPSPSIFGLLQDAKFVLLNLEGQPGAAGHYGDRLERVTAVLATDRPDWLDIREVLIRPDGHVAWERRAGDPPSEPPLASWLGKS